MQLQCPNCGKAIPAENINVQNMVAVCPTCDTLFHFDVPAAKAKRRKIKQPLKLTVREDDNLHLAFHTNVRLNQDENFLSSLIGGVTLTFVSLVMINEFIVNGNVPIVIPVGFVLLTCALYYWIAQRVYNQTHIDMDEDRILVQRKPLPVPFQQSLKIDLDDVIAVRCEETAVSKREAYDTPRFRVWAETASGRQKMIVNDVTDEYAYFITQVLNDRLHDVIETETHPDISHLIDRADDRAMTISDDGEIVPLSKHELFE